jgi:WD40 repeat protein
MRPPPRTLYIHRSLLLLLGLYNIGSSSSFSQTSSLSSLSFKRLSNRFIQSSTVSVRKASPSSDGDNDTDNSTDNDWTKQLLARQLELDRQTNELTRHWRVADCRSGVSLVLPNWVRRLDVDYPLVACGSASETVYIANLETGEILASSSGGDVNNEFADDEEDGELDDDSTPENLEQTLRILYGAFDGGGTIAIAFSGSLICQSKRKGGVELWGLDPASPQLISQGSMRALEGVLVTCLHIDEDNLWVATADGRIQAYPLDSELPLALTRKPDLEWNVSGATIVSMSICAQVGCGVVATSSGNIELFSLEQDGSTLASFYPPFDSLVRKSSNVHALCAIIVSHAKDSKYGSYSIACGGNDGSLYLQPLQMSSDGEVDMTNPFTNRIRPLRPRHMAPLKCLASPAPGLLVSGGQDGTVRVWQMEDAKCLYKFNGYKAWLGSIWTDGVRLVTDGADNTVILHNFDHPASAE